MRSFFVSSCSLFQPRHRFCRRERENEKKKERDRDFFRCRLWLVKEYREKPFMLLVCSRGSLKRRGRNESSKPLERGRKERERERERALLDLFRRRQIENNVSLPPLASKGGQSKEDGARGVALLSRLLERRKRNERRRCCCFCLFPTSSSSSSSSSSCSRRQLGQTPLAKPKRRGKRFLLAFFPTSRRLLFFYSPLEAKRRRNCSFLS